MRCLRKLGSAGRVLGEATDLRKFRKSDTDNTDNSMGSRPGMDI